MSQRPGQPESIEARLIQIALQHIRRDGYTRLTIVRVAAEAGMAHANVYRYFASKAALLERITGDWLRGIEQRLTDIVQAPDPAADKLERFLTFLSRAYFERAETEPKLYAIFADATEAGTEQSTRHRRRVRALLSRILEEGTGTRAFATTDTRRIERLVVDAMHRFLDPHTIRRSAVPPTTAASFDMRRDRVIRVLMQGLQTRW